jgi:hypothetical protein
MERSDEGETGLPAGVTRRHEGDERTAYIVHDCGLDQTLLELVKLRAMGEGDQRLHLLDACQESPFYSDRERAALTWCEAVIVCRMKSMSWRGRSSARRSITSTIVASRAFVRLERG